jgi:hypothetical protein
MVYLSFYAWNLGTQIVLSCVFLYLGSTPPMTLSPSPPRLLGLARAPPRLLGPALTPPSLLGHAPTKLLISPKSSPSLPIMKTFQWSIMIPSFKIYTKYMINKKNVNF